MWRERGRVSASSADVEWFKNGDFLKGLTEFLDMSLGDLVEGIALHAFEGKAPFTPDALAKIEAAGTGSPARVKRSRATACVADVTTATGSTRCVSTAWAPGRATSSVGRRDRLSTQAASNGTSSAGTKRATTSRDGDPVWRFIQTSAGPAPVPVRVGAPGRAACAGTRPAFRRLRCLILACSECTGPLPHK